MSISGLDTEGDLVIRAAVVKRTLHYTCSMVMGVRYGMVLIVASRGSPLVGQLEVLSVPPDCAWKQILSVLLVETLGLCRLIWTRWRHQ